MRAHGAGRYCGDIGEVALVSCARHSSPVDQNEGRIAAQAAQIDARGVKAVRTRSVAAVAHGGIVTGAAKVLGQGGKRLGDRSMSLPGRCRPGSR